MLTNLQNKYKDNNPESTINNIKDFFHNKGYTIKIIEMKEPVPGIYWCHLKLFYKDILIQTANGKGASKQFALASGHSELYERYCTFCGNPLEYKINQKKLFELNLNKYKLFPDEKYITLSYIAKELPILNQFYTLINDN
jgi:ribosomal protein S12 methylthiotransferase accessory factor YcaO